MPVLAAVALVLSLSAPVPVLAPPVPGPVTAPFVAPACRWCPGHRGLTFATAAGGDVVAAADGVVSFAGTVAGVAYVVVLHRDGRLRTTYGHLAGVAVRTGATVRRGQVLGTSGTSLHFGARLGDQYVDPAPLLAAPRRRARLLPLR